MKRLKGTAGPRKAKRRAIESARASRRPARWWPFRGPCGFCGGPDARHRLWDAILDRHRAGDSVADLAQEFAFPVEAVLALLGEPE